MAAPAITWGNCMPPRDSSCVLAISPDSATASQPCLRPGVVTTTPFTSWGSCWSLSFRNGA